MMTYRERIDRLAARKTTTQRQEEAWVALMAHLAATLCVAADNGHVTRPVHRKIEELILEAETKMGLPL